MCVSGLQKDHQCEGTVGETFKRKSVTRNCELKKVLEASNASLWKQKHYRCTKERSYPPSFQLLQPLTLRCICSVAAVLKRWKLNWCDLWIDGSLCFYKTDSRRDLELRVSLKMTCIDVRSGLECGGKAWGLDCQALTAWHEWFSAVLCNKPDMSSAFTRPGNENYSSFSFVMG